MKNFMEMYAKNICGAISGWDRIRFRGTIRWLANTSGINSYLSTRNILLKDFGKWAESITAKVRSMCADQAKQLDIPMIYLPSASIDKEAYARQIMAERNIETGPVCMFSTVEPCLSALLKGNKATKMLELKMAPRKCVWIYQYWNDERLGFGHTRLQTWLPLSTTICLNGRHWLERQFIRENIGYCKDGNCFTRIDDYAKAAELVEEQHRTQWPQLLEGLVARNCPDFNAVLGDYPLEYYWSADETEWATDIVFRHATELDALFPKLARYGLLTANSPAVMRFLGRSGKGRLPNEVRSDHRSRYEGLRLKHWVNSNSVKLYNKAGNVLRTETTLNQPREFKVYRHPDDDAERPASWQKMRKGVSDLHRRAEVSHASNERYLDHLASANIAETLQETAGDICKRIRKDGKNHRALNPWNAEDFQTLQFLARGEHQLNGFVNQQLREALYGTSKDAAQRKQQSGQATRRLRLLRAHGLIRKVKGSNRYQLTTKGRKISAAILAASSADTEQLMDMAA
jgi:DNA-binding MarR family transcriptional regulator